MNHLHHRTHARQPFFTAPPPAANPDTAFEDCEARDPRAIGLRCRSGDRDMRIGIGAETVLRAVCASLDPMRRVVQQSARLSGDQIALLALKGIEVEPTDDPGMFRTVEPIFIGRYYRYR